VWVRFWSPYTLVNLFLLSSRKFLPLLMPTLQQTLLTDLMIDDRPTRVLYLRAIFKGFLGQATTTTNRNERRQRLILSSTTYVQWTIDLWKRRVLIYEWQEYTGGQATISCPSSWPTPGERWRSLWLLAPRVSGDCQKVRMSLFITVTSSIHSAYWTVTSGVP